jgi:hypothetical protein
MKAWLLFLLGTLAYFDLRFMKRKDKTSFDVKFWIKDNWPELLFTFIIDLIAMIILMDADTNITAWLTTKLPDGLVLPAKLLSAAACGLGLGYIGYEFVQRTIKKSKGKSN